MPLLFGLLDASEVKRSLDIPMGVDSPEYSDVDPDELIAEWGRNAEFDSQHGQFHPRNWCVPFAPCPLPRLTLALLFTLEGITRSYYDFRTTLNVCSTP